MDHVRERSHSGREKDVDEGPTELHKSLVVPISIMATLVLPMRIMTTLLNHTSVVARDFSCSSNHGYALGPYV